MPAFTALDIIVLILVGGAGVLGFLRGFSTEVLSLFAWLLAVFALKFLHAPVAHALEGSVGTWGGASVLAFTLVFGITFFIGRLTARTIGGRIRQSVLGGFDRILGVGFGALKGLIIATVIYLIVTLFYDTVYGGVAKRPDWMTQSRTYPLLNASGRALVDFVQAGQKATPAKPENAAKSS
ncbi:CvpA family protein [Sphingobium boeckii]|uniref:Membrane protein required for colicin V production n=1 Tax=Sphingobium boeckii TaxID=1082345 RepID=A0A7W9EF56_9SPHN|nr:CvpA family protein [Sphingobium boeckii]MBB5686958.1 membrane protein required for colicin V production [Sphingobium boeckii]